MRTGSDEQRNALRMHLKMVKIENCTARACAEPSPKRLNFLIDPSWGGETPRVLVIRADGSRIGISRELNPAQLQRLR